MVSAQTLLNYIYETITLTLLVEAYDKNSVAVFIHNNKNIGFVYIRISKSQCTHTMTEKEILCNL